MARLKPPGRKKKTRWFFQAGTLTYRKVELLVALTGIRSRKQIRAIEMVLVQGLTVHESAAMFKVTISNLNRDILKLNKVAGIVERIKKDEADGSQENP